MENVKVGNKIEVSEFSSDIDLVDWCGDNERYIDEVTEVDMEGRLLWCKNIPFGISFDDVTQYSDEDYIYWGYDNV